MQRNKPMTGRERYASLYVRRDVRLADGREFAIWAFPRGTKPTASWTDGWAPDFVWVLQGVYQFVAHWFVYRGAWEIEIRNPKTDEALDARDYPSRARALAAFEEARARLATQTFDHVGRALSD